MKAANTSYDVLLTFTWKTEKLTTSYVNNYHWANE